MRQEPGVDYERDGDVLRFPRRLARDRVSGWRWLLGAFGIGTYRQDDSVDVRYERDGQPRLAERLRDRARGRVTARWRGASGCARRRSEYRDGDGSVLVLRGALTPATRAALRADRAAARTCAPAASREDAWQRAFEFLFERLAVSWTIAGTPPLTRQRELLGAAARRLAAPSARGCASACASTAPSTSRMCPRRERRRPRRRAPARRARSMRRTKIVATIGPASREPEVLARLVEAGMDVARLNYSHGILEEHAETAERVRAGGEPRRAPGRDPPGPARAEAADRRAARRARRARARRHA